MMRPVLAVALALGGCRVPLDVIGAGPEELPSDGGAQGCAPGTLALYNDSVAGRRPAQLAVAAGELFLLDAWIGPGSPGAARLFGMDTCRLRPLRSLLNVAPYNLGGRPVLAASADAAFFAAAGSSTSAGDELLALDRGARTARIIAGQLGSVCAVSYDLPRRRVLVARCDAGIDAVDPASGARQPLIAGRNVAMAPLAVDDAAIAWVERQPGRAVLMPAQGGAPMVLFTDAMTPQAVALDATYVYVATAAGLVRIPRAGGAPERVGQAQATTVQALTTLGGVVYAAGPQGIFRLENATLVRLAADMPARLLVNDGADLYAAVDESRGLARIVRVGTR